MLSSAQRPDPGVHRQEKAALLREEPQQYEKYAREWTSRYAGWSRVEDYPGTLVIDAGSCPVGTQQQTRQIRGRHIPDPLAREGDR
mmetsp:Transcript_127291/g.360211  ORF Transcript_127291/g.360211 Transcript_127291/m.360211 type:complete len:86 (-) Transcript_127291:45-302(-)